ncbi:MAG TPA: hypothetical protein VEU32_09250 [Burkholderiales bacterium]|nr:hypothetical protein [Burkholderiales bacterium]
MRAQNAQRRRLAGAILLSLCLHAALFANVKPVSARYAGGLPARLEARIVGAPPEAGGDAHGVRHLLAMNRKQVEGNGAGAQGGSTARALIDTTLLKSYLKARAARPGNLPDGRNARVEIDLALLNEYYNARELDRRAEPLEEVPLNNPRIGPEPGRAVKVILLLLINDSGGVDSVATLEAPPAGGFAEMARAAFTTTRFSPAFKDGRPVKSQKVVEILYGS